MLLCLAQCLCLFGRVRFGKPLAQCAMLGFQRIVPIAIGNDVSFARLPRELAEPDSTSRHGVLGRKSRLTGDRCRDFCREFCVHLVADLDQNPKIREGGGSYVTSFSTFT